MAHLIFLLLLLLLHLLACTESFPTNNNCSVFYCGNKSLPLHYPFWNTQTEEAYYCGYPSFGLACDWNARKPVLKLPHGCSFYVEHIDYSLKTLRLVDLDVMADQYCPRVRRNVTLDESGLLSYSPAVKNLTYFFDCSSWREDSEPVECLSNGNKQSFMFPEDEIPEFNWLGKCEGKVVAPVSDAFLGVQYGFDLTWGWVPEYCLSCQKSSGWCGGSKKSPIEMEHLCFCENGETHPRSCPNKPKVNRSSAAVPPYTEPRDLKSKNGSKAVKIGVAVGVGSFFIVACFLIFFFLRRYHRRKQIDSKLLSRNISAEPSFSTKHDLEKCDSTVYATHVFSYKELQEATKNFDSEEELGDGGFGTVYYGKLRDGRPVAVKRLYENNYKRVEQFLNEVKILSTLRHRNLVTLYGCTSRHSRELLLVYEFISNGTVADHLHGNKVIDSPLTWPVRMSIAIETAEALAYLHAVEPPIIHRDVKTNNILLDNNFQVKVADFGLSRLFPMDVSHVSTVPQGTPGYVDPDYHKCYQLTDKSDVYSFGVVLVELISSMPAVDITRHRHEINLATLAINKIHNQALHELVDPSLGFETDEGVRRRVTSVAGLAFRCLQEEKEGRPSMVEVVKELKGIEEEESREEKKKADTPVDEVGLLKYMPPPSPDSVMDATFGTSTKSTTPNTSG